MAEVTLFGFQMVLAVCLFSFAPSAEAAERLAVLELSSDAEPQIPSGQLAALTDAVRKGVGTTLGDSVQVMTRENMEVMLTDMGLDASCIAEGACEVETARNLGVDYVVSGAITSFGPKLVVSLKLHATQTGQLLGSEQLSGDDTFSLLSTLPDSASVAQ